jgi:CheY-like chemotaxis protein
MLAEPGCTDADRHEAADVIAGAVQRGAELTSQLLGFAGRTRATGNAVDVHGLIEDVTRLLVRTIPRSVRIEHHFGAARAVVHGDGGQLQQVLLNLALNARDAMPAGGALRFETRAERSARGPQDEIGDWLELRVIDTGVGIAEPLLERIFEPFFTTKEAGAGSGMGLAVVYGIVSSHGGQVRVESALGRGTSFILRLPMLEERVESSVNAASAAAGTDGSGHVLVVDDDPAVRTVLVRMLRRLGYEVTSVSDGEEAVAAYASAKGRIRLVVLDLDMPKMDGAECFRRLRELDPDARVLLSTGYERPGIVDGMRRQGLAAVLQKPYALEGLSSALADALAGAREDEGPSGTAAIRR